MAGLLVIPGLFPAGRRFILRVISKRPEQGFQHFRELGNGDVSYVTGIRNVDDYERHGLRAGLSTPTVKRVLTVLSFFSLIQQ